MHIKTEADASVTEELIAIDQSKSDKEKKNLEWERSRNKKGPDTREIEKGEGHNREIERNRDRKARRVE